MPDFYSQVELPPLPPIFPAQTPGRSTTWGNGSREVLGAGGYGPWKYGGRLYTLILTAQRNESWSYDVLYNGFFNVYRSDDGGLSWTAKDPDHGPRYPLLGHFNQQASKITVFCVVNPDDFLPFQLYDFDLITDTWSEPYAIGLEDADFRYFCQSLTRANGNTALITAPNDFTGALQMNEWNGTTWTTPFRLDAPGEGGLFVAAMLEPESGNIHLEYERQNFDPRELVHRVIRPDNSLGPVSILWTDDGDFIGDQYPKPIAFFKDKAYIFIYDNTIVGTTGLGGELAAGYYVFIGTPASEPTSFTLTPVTGPIPQISMNCACAVVAPDGLTMHCIYGYNNPANPGVDPESLQFRRAETTNGTDWSSTLFCDLWPQNPQDFILSASYIGAGGIDGIGAFAMTGFEEPWMAFYMVKNAGGGGRAIGNRFY